MTNDYANKLIIIECTLKRLHHHDPIQLGRITTRYLQFTLQVPAKNMDSLKS